jgi:hypothetical protein
MSIFPASFSRSSIVYNTRSPVSTSYEGSYVSVFSSPSRLIIDSCYLQHRKSYPGVEMSTHLPVDAKHLLSSAYFRQHPYLFDYVCASRYFSLNPRLFLLVLNLLIRSSSVALSPEQSILLLSGQAPSQIDLFFDTLCFPAPVRLLLFIVSPLPSY